VLDVQFGDSLSIVCGPGGLGGYSVFNSLQGLAAGAGYDTVITRTGPSGTRVLKFLGAPQGIKGALGTENATYRDMSIPGAGYNVFLGKNGAIPPTPQEANQVNITRGGFSGGSGEGPGTTNYTLEGGLNSEVPRPLYAWDIGTYIDGGRYATVTEGIITSLQIYNGLPGESSQYAAGGRGGVGLPLTPNFCGGGGGGGAGFGSGGQGGDGQASTNFSLGDGGHGAAGSSAGGGGGGCTYSGLAAASTRAGRGGRGGSGKVIITY
jgi:hypothetical protein